jgi:hypothetical protein
MSACENLSVRAVVVSMGDNPFISLYVSAAASQANVLPNRDRSPRAPRFLWSLCCLCAAMTRQCLRE